MGLLTKLFNDASDTDFKLAQDLVTIAIADGEISEAEQNVINEICKSEGISNDTIQLWIVLWDSIKKRMFLCLQRKEKRWITYLN